MTEEEQDRIDDAILEILKEVCTGQSEAEAAYNRFNNLIYKEEN